MLAASLFRNEQEKYEINRAIIDGVKIDRPLQPGKQAEKSRSRSILLGFQRSIAQNARKNYFYMKVLKIT